MFLSSFVACSGAPRVLYLVSLDRGKWPRCLLQHGWLPGLSCSGERDPWAASFGELACLGLNDAEFWSAILAMQAYWPCHLRIGNRNVARTIGRLLDNDCLVKPLPLVTDGDLVALIQYVIRTRGRRRFGSLKLKGHADDADPGRF